MLRSPDPGRPAPNWGVRWLSVPTAIVALTAICAAAPAGALAAKLVGGHRQAAIARAFSRTGAHRHLLIVSIRVSTASPSWAVVKSVAPNRRSTRVSSTYFHDVGGRELPGKPPHRALSDLGRPFSVAVVYSGAGSESVRYQQPYRSGCAGAGGFVDQQTETVSPMSWTVRYLVDLDSLVSAVRTAQGAAIVPAVQFEASGSRLTAVEKLSRSYVDQGCFNHPTNLSCTSTFQLTGGGADDDLAFDPGSGTEIAIPMVAHSRGQCSPDDYTIGPSLWDSGASTALVGRLGLLGMLAERLPANPYAPIRVSWPGASAGEQQGFLVGPCQGIPSACSDQLLWHATVRLMPVSGG